MSFLCTEIRVTVCKPRTLYGHSHSSILLHSFPEALSVSAVCLSLDGRRHIYLPHFFHHVQRDWMISTNSPKGRGRARPCYTQISLPDVGNTKPRMPSPQQRPHTIYSLPIVPHAFVKIRTLYHFTFCYVYFQKWKHLALLTLGALCFSRLSPSTVACVLSWLCVKRLSYMPPKDVTQEGKSGFSA